MSQDTGSRYPTATRGGLSDGDQRYKKPIQPKGPKSDHAQRNIFLIGLLFFIVFTVLFAFAMGFGNYIDSKYWSNNM